MSDANISDDELDGLFDDLDEDMNQTKVMPELTIVKDDPEEQADTADEEFPGEEAPAEAQEAANPGEVVKLEAAEPEKVMQLHREMRETRRALDVARLEHQRIKDASKSKKKQVDALEARIIELAGLDDMAETGELPFAEAEDAKSAEEHAEWKDGMEDNVETAAGLREKDAEFADEDSAGAWLSLCAEYGDQECAEAAADMDPGEPFTMALLKELEVDYLAPQPEKKPEKKDATGGLTFQNGLAREMYDSLAVVHGAEKVNEHMKLGEDKLVTLEALEDVEESLEESIG